VYPLERLGAIGSDAKVGIEGIGLTAHDVVAELTAGAGRALRAATASALRYTPLRPRAGMLLFSRNCLPAAARGINQKGAGRAPQSPLLHARGGARAARAGVPKPAAAPARLRRANCCRCC
jgi:hypothetical protein